jgi:quinol monooxygenase YgiN
MYGTVAKMRIKPGSLEQLQKLSDEYSREIDGVAFQHVIQSDADPEECWLCVGFTSKEAYKANAASPEQHKRYEQYRALLAAEPEWHDGAVVNSRTA